MRRSILAVGIGIVIAGFVARGAVRVLAMSTASAQQAAIYLATINFANGVVNELQAEVAAGAGMTSGSIQFTDRPVSFNQPLDPTTSATIATQLEAAFSAIAATAQTNLTNLCAGGGC